MDAAGTVWLATDGGLFRIVPQGGPVRGPVDDPLARGRGSRCHMQGTPFHTVTDAEGRFALANVPGGTQQVQFDGRLAAAGPFTMHRPRGHCGPTRGHRPWSRSSKRRCQGPATRPGIGGRANRRQWAGRCRAPGGGCGADRREPVPNVPVTFTVTAGGGTLDHWQPVLTDAQGQAAID